MLLPKPWQLNLYYWLFYFLLVAGGHSKNKEEGKSKEKKKKKSKLVSESLATNVEDNHLESVATVEENKVKDGVSTDAKVINGSEKEKKSKSKMKKKDKQSGQGDVIEQIGDPNETVSKDENIEASNKEMMQAISSRVQTFRSYLILLF